MRRDVKIYDTNSRKIYLLLLSFYSSGAGIVVPSTVHYLPVQEQDAISMNDVLGDLPVAK